MTNDVFVNCFLIFTMLLIGFLFGRIVERMMWINRKKKQNKKAGTFYINTTDPHEDTIRVELDIPIGEMMEKKELRFVVEHEE